MVLSDISDTQKIKMKRIVGLTDELRGKRKRPSDKSEPHCLLFPMPSSILRHGGAVRVLFKDRSSRIDTPELLDVPLFISEPETISRESPR